MISLRIPQTNQDRHSDLKTKSKNVVIHRQVPLPVPCYDLLPLTESALGPLKIAGTSGIPSSLELTGGEYKTQEHVHRALADTRLLAIPASRGRVSDLDPN